MLISLVTEPSVIEVSEAGTPNQALMDESTAPSMTLGSVTGWPLAQFFTEMIYRC